MTKKVFDHPAGVEREYTRLMLQFSKELKRASEEFLVPMLDDLLREADREMRGDSWSDTLDNIMDTLNRRAAANANVVIEKLPGEYAALSKFNERQFKMVVKANTGYTLPDAMPSMTTLGVNVFRDEPYLQPLAQNWIRTNTDLIKSIPTRFNPELEGIVRRGVTNGQSVKDMTKLIRDRYGVTDYRAKLIAQDQINKGNADLTKHRLQSVGVNDYIWRSVQDTRVRPEHVEYNGNQYAFDKPPPEGNPGQPVRCRCRAEGIFPEEDEATPPTERKATSKEKIWGDADRAWHAENSPRDKATMDALRKRLIPEIMAKYNIPKATVTAQLNSWKNARLQTVPVKRVAPLKPIPETVLKPVAPPKAPPKPTDPFAPAPDIDLYGAGTPDHLANWQDASFSKAPLAMKQLLARYDARPSITYRTFENGEKVGAYCSYERSTINMGDHRIGSFHSEAVWRHEFGHYLDKAMDPRGQAYGTKKYTSETAPWKAAMSKDKARVIAKDTMTPLMRTEISARGHMYDALGFDVNARDEWLTKRYASMGIDYKDMEALVRQETYLYTNMTYLDVQDVHLHLADALQYGRAERFLTAMQQNWQLQANTKRSLGKFSDLIGSVTHNALGGHRTGFGHTSEYYKQSVTNAGTEVFANLTSLYGGPNARAWSKVLEKLVPSVDAEYRKILWP